jgi:hypothetical protein
MVKTDTYRQNNSMKNLLFLLILFVTIWSCTNPTNQNSNSADTTIAINDQTTSTDTSKVKTPNNSNLADTLSLINNTSLIDPTKTEINGAFPFGCIDLRKFKYPKHWKGHEEGLEQPQGKEFEDIGQYFQKINSSKTLGSFKVNTLEIVKIGDDYKEFGFDTLLIKSIDNCLYHLPKIGIYECYYFYGQTRVKSLGDYGNLLLLDPLTRNGKLVNIYFEYGGDQNVNFRYFIIDNETIKLYEGSCYDDGCGLAETYRISINQDGKVNIKQIKS